MKSVNLIPTPRRQAKRRRKHRRAGVAACAGYTALLACAVGVAHLLWSGATEAVDERLAAADADIQRLQRQGADARAELASARATVEANRTVSEQPDWSVLLALLASKTSESKPGEDVVLRSLSIAPPFAPAAAASPAGSAGAKVMPEVALEILGIGRTPVAVSQHVLRLEQTGLFSKVALVDTGREAYLRGNAIAFRLQCTFGEPRQTSTSTAAPTPPALTGLETGGINR